MGSGEKGLTPLFQKYVILDAERQKAGSLKVKPDPCPESHGPRRRRELLSVRNMCAQTLPCVSFRLRACRAATRPSPELAGLVCGVFLCCCCCSHSHASFLVIPNEAVLKQLRGESGKEKKNGLTRELVKVNNGAQFKVM